MSSPVAGFLDSMGTAGSSGGGMASGGGSSGVALSSRDGAGPVSGTLAPSASGTSAAPR